MNNKKKGAKLNPIERLWMRRSKDIYQFTIEEGWVYIKNNHCISLMVLLPALSSVAQGLEYRQH